MSGGVMICLTWHIMIVSHIALGYGSSICHVLMIFHDLATYPLILLIMVNNAMMTNIPSYFRNIISLRNSPLVCTTWNLFTGHYHSYPFFCIFSCAEEVVVLGESPLDKICGHMFSSKRMVTDRCNIGNTGQSSTCTFRLLLLVVMQDTLGNEWMTSVTHC